METKPELMTNLQALIEQEQRLSNDAACRLGNIVQITEYGLALLNTAIGSIRANNELIAGIQLAIQKSATLAYISYCRSHSAQAEFNCRQVIEYTCLGAYFLAHPDGATHRTDEAGNVTITPTQTINRKVYSWMAKAMPDLSDALKNFKDALNESVLHGCLYGTSLTMDYKEATDQYNGSFFDNVSPDCYRAWLLRLCEIIALSLTVLRTANGEHEAIIYREKAGPQYATFIHCIEKYREGFGEYLTSEPAKL